MEESVMETNKLSRFTVNENDSSAVNENDSSGAGRGGLSSDSKSLVILTLVLLTLFGSAGALTAMWVDDAGFSAVTNAAAPAVPYVPSQYVNPAREIEPQPPTF
jgi:hypothetical protein